MPLEAHISFGTCQVTHFLALELSSNLECTQLLVWHAIWILRRRLQDWCYMSLMHPVFFLKWLCTPNSKKHYDWYFVRFQHKCLICSGKLKKLTCCIVTKSASYNFCFWQLQVNLSLCGWSAELVSVCICTFRFSWKFFVIICNTLLRQGYISILHSYGILEYIQCINQTL